jgi:hypothetical protein
MSILQQDKLPGFRAKKIRLLRVRTIFFKLAQKAESISLFSTDDYYVIESLSALLYQRSPRVHMLLVKTQTTWDRDEILNMNQKFTCFL